MKYVTPFALSLILVGCPSPGSFMSTVPHFERSEVPFTLCVSAYSGDPGETTGVRKLADYALDVVFAKRLGFKLFTMQPVGSTDCDAILIVNAPRDPQWLDAAGTCEYDPSVLTGVRCLMQTSNTGTDELTTLTIEHELGHCAGLDHDEWRGSIMYPELHVTEPGSWPPWLSDHERELLRSAYGPL